MVKVTITKILQIELQSSINMCPNANMTLVNGEEDFKTLNTCQMREFGLV